MVTLWLWIGHGSVVMKIDQSPDWDLWIVAFVFHSIWSTVCVNSTCMNIDNLYSMSHYDHYRTYSRSQTYILVYRSPTYPNEGAQKRSHQRNHTALVIWDNSSWGCTPSSLRNSASISFSTTIWLAQFNMAPKEEDYFARENNGLRYHRRAANSCR